MKYTFTLLALCSITLIASAQITIDRNDYELIVGSNSTITHTAENVMGSSFDIGGTGGGQTWDLSELNYTVSVQNNTYSDPSGTTYAAQFPNATHALRIESTQGSGYTYMRLKDDGIYTDGTGGVFSGESHLMDYDPDKPNLLFPATLGDSWNYDGNPMSIGTDITQQTRSTYEIDAAGTLFLPGEQHSCLRVRTTDWHTIQVESGGMIVYEAVTKVVVYNFVTKTGLIAIINADTSSPATGNISLNALNYMQHSGATSVEEYPHALDLMLNPAYPNPVQSNGATTLSWNQEEQDFVSLKVYDILGTEVATVYQGITAPGQQSWQFSTANLLPGMYIVRLSSAGSSFQSILSVSP
jgi:Secretion system C-terminal sorting domain